MNIIACDHCGKRFKKGEDYIEAGIAIQHANGAVSGHPGSPAHLHADCVAGYVEKRIADAVAEQQE